MGVEIIMRFLVTGTTGFAGPYLDRIKHPQANDEFIQWRGFVKLIEYNDKKYPYFQTAGQAAQFALPFAKYFCEGVGVDVGCKNREWALPGAIPIDLEFSDLYHAGNLPEVKLNYIFSSHWNTGIKNQKWVELCSCICQITLKNTGAPGTIKNTCIYSPHR